MKRELGTVVVLGGSVSGILAAAIAAKHAERVVIVERDALGEAVPRKGVPQSRHNHNLYARGRAIMERILPGVTDELCARGASAIDAGMHGRWTIAGHRLARTETGHVSIFASRPCIDAALLARVRALPNVSISDRTDVLGWIHTEGRVTGVRTLRRDDSAEHTIESDLVIDATGRGSRTPAWLEALGYAAPETDELEVRVAYVTRVFRRREGDLGGDRSVIIGSVPPDRPRGGVAFAVEGDRWMVLLFGYGDARPPMELEGFRAYARTLASPDIAELVANAEPLDDGAPFTYPKAVRRRYDLLARMPEGLLVLGDALVSTNPSYGAGMTSAALQAEALEACLALGTRGLGRRWHRAAIAASGDVWSMTTGSDLGLDCVEGEPPLPVAWISRYLRVLAAAAAHDPVLSRALIRVVDRVAHRATIFAPRIVWRALFAPPRPALLPARA